MYNSIIIYLILSFTLLLSGTVLSYKFNLLDKPSKRKVHSKPTAYTGGLIIALIYLFSLQLFDDLNHELNLIISMSIMIALIGFVDDRYHLNTGSKLSLQLIIVFYLIFIKNINLNQIGDYGYFVLELFSFSQTFTLLCVLFLINAFNYFDGIDGSLSFTLISVLSILYFLIPDEKIRTLLIMVLIPILIFLCFNFSIFNLPKLFLGDSGSLLLGFIISFIIIYCANKNLAHPILLAWSIAIFVYEFLSTNLERLINKKNPFKAGLDHLHYRLLKKTRSIFLTNLLIFNLNIILFGIGYIFFYFINPLSSLVLFISLFVIFFIFRSKYLIKRNKN